MGKKKSVALMVILTIVIVALCALVLFPSVPVGVKDWKPVASQYDFSTEIDGGYYAYYYPEGVIPEADYNEEKLGYEEIRDSANSTAKEKEDAIDDLEKLEKDYQKYKGLYLSTEDVWVNGEVSDEFAAGFKKAADEIAKRYEAKGYADYRVAVVDDYALRVELPRVENNYASVFSMFAMTGELSITLGEEVVEELKEDGVKAKDLIESFSLDTKYDAAFVKVKFTDKGKAMIERVKEELSDSNTATTALHIKLGEQDLAIIYSDWILDNNRVARVLPYQKEYKDAVEIYSVLLSSVLENEMDFAFDTSRIEARSFSSVYGENTLTLLYIALGVAILAAIILPIIKMGRFGVVSVYGSLSFLIVVGICFKYITAGVFELTLGGILMFLLGLVLINAVQAYIYRAIKKEFQQGKTIASAVKGGYKKTLWAVVDMYAILLLGALALLIGVGGVQTLAIHALVAVVTAAFCNLLWARCINYVFLSASKNQFKYFRFVREEDDDDDE
ncbi:MAG: hypothetical protein E7355_03770 [Clostridiales bacterium]|nr:hypothetical protein [Clostridiales bacterium]